MDWKGDYGNAESLSYLGVQYVHGTNNIEIDYQKGMEFFEKALTFDEKDK